MNFDINEKQRDLIIGTMERWLGGEPVWPLDRVLKKWGRGFENYRVAWRRGDYGLSQLDDHMKLFMLRDQWTEKFGFAIPCKELIEVCRKHAPILDVGAGTGYMTKLMRNAGIDVTGTDAFKFSYGWQCGIYDDKQKTITAKAAIRAAKNRPTVFCSWPTYDHTWFRQALKAMNIGQRLIVVRESATADESAWAYLDKCFAEEETIQIPCWPHMHDCCEVWVKKRQRKP